MNAALDLDALVQPARLSALVARSQRNIERSRALVTAAEVIVRVGLRLRRPRFAGGSDGPEAAPPRVMAPRILRTFTKLKTGALPTDGARRRWVGRGRDERCNGCGDPITPRETEVELDFRDALLLRFHAECVRAWENFDGQAP